MAPGKRLLGEVFEEMSALLGLTVPQHVLYPSDYLTNLAVMQNSRQNLYAMLSLDMI